MTEMSVELSGRRVLIVEDEPLIALDIETMVDSLGCTVAGMTGDLKTAVKLAQDLQLDVVLLDLLLKNDSTFDVAKILMDRSIPVILATGMDGGSVPAAYKNLPFLGKPFSQEQLGQQLRAVTRSHDAIEMTAYFLWEQDGRPDGKADKYWEAAKALYEREREADDLLARRPD